MNQSSRSATEFNVILALLGLGIFIIGLFNRKTRGVAGRALQFGGGMLANHLAKKYFPQTGYHLVKVVSSYLPLQGNKGGKATKRTFRKNSSSGNIQESKALS